MQWWRRPVHNLTEGRDSGQKGRASQECLFDRLYSPGRPYITKK